MFSTPLVPVILSQAKLVRGTNDDGESTCEAHCQITLDPFRPELAHELGEGIAAHLFATVNGEEKPRPELQNITLTPRIPMQAVAVSPTDDGSYIAGTLRYVSFGDLTVSKVQKGALVWLKATQRITFEIASPDHRELLIKSFGEILYLSFQAEQGDMLESVAERVTKNLNKPGAVAAAFENMRPTGDGQSISMGMAGGPMTTLHADGRTETTQGKKAH